MTSNQQLSERLNAFVRNIWFSLSQSERELLQEAVAALKRSNGEACPTCAKLRAELADPPPDVQELVLRKQGLWPPASPVETKTRHLPQHEQYSVPTVERIREAHSQVPTGWWQSPGKVSPGHPVYAQGNDPCYLCVLLAEIDRLRADLERLSIGSRGNVWEEVRALRSALDRIRGFRCSSFRSYKEDLDDIRAIAREALSDVRQGETSGEEDATKLRRLLAFCYSSHRLYLDDGEMQDNSVQPFIDWKRDSVDEIVRKIHERGLAQIMRSVETTSVPAAHRAGTEPLSRLAGDIEWCLTKINPDTDVYATLHRVQTALRGAVVETTATVEDRVTTEDIKVGATVFKAGCQVQTVLSRIYRGLNPMERAAEKARGDE